MLPLTSRTEDSIGSNWHKLPASFEKLLCWEMLVDRWFDGMITVGQRCRFQRATSHYCWLRLLIFHVWTEFPRRSLLCAERLFLKLQTLYWLQLIKGWAHSWPVDVRVLKRVSWHDRLFSSSLLLWVDDAIRLAALASRYLLHYIPFVSYRPQKLHWLVLNWAMMLWNIVRRSLASP